MNINKYLQNNLKNLCEEDIYNLKMEDYDNFKKFIDKHYNLNHLRNNNYLKFVKVTRQKIALGGNTDYEELISKINNIFQLMSEHYLFYKINFRKYLFNIKKIFSLLKKRDNALNKELERFQELYDIFDIDSIKFKILKTINSVNRKIQLFNIYKRELLYLINCFIELEYEHDISQKLINIVNNERALIGKKSEYNVNIIINNYIKKQNLELDQKKYYYLENIDIFKLFNIKINNNVLKGEIDGIIISKNGNDYIIENIIEIKSSIKATFEDIYKIIGLKNFLLNYNFNNRNFQVNNLILNEKSFEKLINYNVDEWLIYICTDDRNKIDKSHLYFSYILKIIDYDFIEDYYIKNEENIIKKKHKMIIKNEDYINNLFNIWKIHLNIKKNSSCLYILNTL